MQLVIMQFTCANGRIILSLKTHEWMKSSISMQYAGLTSVAFVSLWNVNANSVNSGTSTPSVGNKRANNITPPPPAAKHRRPLQEVNGPVPHTGASPSHHPSLLASKHSKYVRDGIDESIENGKIGMYVACDQHREGSNKV